MRALPLCAFTMLGCSFAADYGGTAYRCDQRGECPSGYVCVAGDCVQPGSQADAASPPSWWDDDWKARRPLTIRNLAAAPLAAGFQVGWQVNVRETVGEDDFGSLRVVAYQANDDTWTDLPRVVDAGTSGDELVWFTLPAALDPDQTAVVWLYFDHADDPDAPWSGSDVFLLNDSLAALDPDRWVTAGAVIDEGQEIRFDTGAEMRSAEPWPTDRAVDIVARAQNAADRFWFGFQREEPDFDPDVPWLVWIRRAAGDQMMPEYAGKGDTVETAWSGSPVAVASGDHVFTVERFGDRVVYRLDDRIASEDHDHALDEAHSAPLYLRFSNTGAASYWVSRVRVRQAAYPPPELTLGAREDFPSP